MNKSEFAKELGARAGLTGVQAQKVTDEFLALLTEAIAKGVVDGSLGAWELVYPTKLSEVTKFHAQPAPGVAHPTATVLTVLMNKQKYDNLMVVSPDVGGVVRARALAKRLEADLAIIDKRRPRPNVATVMNIIGEVAGRTCVIVDDMVDTANTLCEAAGALKKQGAHKVIAYCTHAVLSGPAIDRITNSALDSIVVTDTIPLTEAGRNCPKIRVLTVAGLLAETMRRISAEDSVSSLFVE